MAEAIGLASGIVGLATVAVQVTEISYRYYTGVKGAPTEIKELLDELNSLSQVLNALKEVAKKSPHSTALRKLSESINGVDGPLPQCLDMLSDLKTKLERSKSEQGRWRRFLHRLKWPLVQGDTQQYISRIQRQRSLFTTALNIDHLSLSTEIRESVGKTEIAIRDLQTQAEEEKKVRLAEKQTKKYQKTLHWLHPYDTVTKQIHITSRRHPNTGGWIFETPEFKAFEKASSLGSGSQLLWGYGIPGAGKSFLSSFIIDYFLGKAAAQDYGVAYVYFDFKEKDTQTPLHTLASLVKQLASQTKTLPAELDKLYDRCMDNAVEGRPTFEELYNILNILFKSFNQAFLIFDALDECDQREQRTELLKLIHRMRNDGANMFVTSRQHPGDIQESFREAQKIELSAHGEDIATYIRQTINNDLQAKRLIKQAKCEKRIVSELTESAHGMFLMVHFHVEYLCQQTTGRQILSALEKLKTSSADGRPLDNTYRRAMETIRGQTLVRAKLGMDVLSWLVNSRRPLTLEELRVAISVEPGRYELDDLNLLVEMTTILDVCAGLAMFDKNGNTIRLVHYTVEEYILENSVLQGAEFTLAMACTTFLSFDILAKGPCSDKVSFMARVKSHPFLLYAVRYLRHHLVQCDETLSVDMVLKLCESPGNVSSYYQVEGCYDEIEDFYLNFYLNCQNYPKDVPSLHLASSLGHYQAVQALLNKGADISLQDSSGFTALHAAVRDGPASVVQLLIDSGADILAQEEEGWTALHIAALWGNYDVVKLLLDNGAEISTQTHEGHTALHQAARVQSYEVVKLLIEKGVDISAQDDTGFTALHLAANEGYDEIVRLLIEKGADVSTQAREGETPLNLASRYGHETIAKQLIQHGADITAKDKHSRTPLHRAALHGHTAVVKLLLDSGADITTRNGNEWTALHLAADDGHTAVVRLLIDRGIDISARAEFGHTALEFAATNGHAEVQRVIVQKFAEESLTTDGGSSGLIEAAIHGCDAVVKMLITSGADIAARDWDGSTALHGAARNGHTDILRHLLQCGADISAVDTDNQTALHSAIFAGQRAAAKLLIDSGIDISVQNILAEATALHLAVEDSCDTLVALLLDKGAAINAQNTFQESALHLACEGGRDPVAAILIDRGADMALRDNQGRSALHRAAQNGCEAVVKALLDKGADIGAKDKGGETPLHVVGHVAVARLLVDGGADRKVGDGKGRTPGEAAGERGLARVAAVIDPMLVQPVAGRGGGGERGRGRGKGKGKGKGKGRGRGGK